MVLRRCIMLVLFVSVSEALCTACEIKKKVERRWEAVLLWSEAEVICSSRRLAAGVDEGSRTGRRPQRSSGVRANGKDALCDFLLCIVPDTQFHQCGHSGLGDADASRREL